jgi:hypothetical protein
LRCESPIDRAQYRSPQWAFSAEQGNVFNYLYAGKATQERLTINHHLTSTMSAKADWALQPDSSGVVD